MITISDGTCYSRGKFMFETAILVLLYNKEITDSNTINSLIESKFQYPNARLVIWNNGPEQLKKRDYRTFEDLGYDVVIEETLNNESLAVIYNRFLTQNRAEKYILLDDDSVLNAAYILASSKSKAAEVGMPIISSQGEAQSPTIDGLPYSAGTEFSSESKVTTIGSGLVIGADIVDSLKEHYKNVFDERFYLYGVDTTFCLRLFNNKLTDMIKIIPGFNHSLSRLEKEDFEKAKFRCLERSYDLGLTLRYYEPRLSSIFIVIKLCASTLKRTLLGKKVELNFVAVLKGFVFGKHYRFGK